MRLIDADDLLKRFNKKKQETLFTYDLEELIESQPTAAYGEWHVAADGDLPKDDNYILLSFSNFSGLLIGRYEEDEDGNGAFYCGDEMETLASQNIFVNAWMPLPEPYKEVCMKKH